MTCPRCHAENRDGLRFCEDCGTRLTLTCAQCGGDLAPGGRFCSSCGTPAGIESAGRTPSPKSYTPKHLAERILISKAAVRGWQVPGMPGAEPVLSGGWGVRSPFVTRVSVSDTET
jgi:hypothetical protein